VIGAAEAPEVGRARRVADGLDFPTSIAFDDAGRPWVAESGLPFAGARPGGRLLRIDGDGRATPVAGGLRPPLNGLLFHDGRFYACEGGDPGRISRLTPAGARETVLDGLPGLGNYHTNMAVMDADGRLVFSQGAMTNSGVIGLDAFELAWLDRLPHDCDLPGFDLVLTGASFETPDPLADDGPRVRTGAFAPFGTPTAPRQRIPARLPATAAVMRCTVDGGGLELVGWGLRNAYGLCLLPDGRLLATDQGADERGSRPIGHAPDLLFEVKPGRWYGWPDFVGGRPVTDERFRPVRGAAPTPLLANHDELPPPERPLLEFPVNAAATKMAAIPAGAGRWPGQVLVTLFGDEKPMTAPAGARVGRSLARIDPAGWTLHPLAAGPFHRPIDVRLHPFEETVYVLDFGEFEMTHGGLAARAGSGVLWALPLADL
jgi:sugar lactone lactonase YvrE